MFLELAAGAWLVGNYIYHRYMQDQPKLPPGKDLEIPRIDEGAPIPIPYGRCKVKQPILAWIGTTRANPASSAWVIPGMTGGAEYLYTADLFYILGFRSKFGTNKIYAMWVGEQKMQQYSGDPVPIANLTGDVGTDPIPFYGSSSYRAYMTNRWNVYPNYPQDGVGYIGGYLAFYNGSPTQAHAHPVNVGVLYSQLGQNMTDSGISTTDIPGYRGYLSVHLYGFTGEDPGFAPNMKSWALGASPQIGAYSFEVGVYPLQYGYAITDEANPANVLFDVITAEFGRLNMQPVSIGDVTTVIDPVTFQAAAITLFNEGHGYSRSIESGESAEEIIRGILEQIDAALYEDPNDGLIKIKLIRDDYSVLTIPRIDPNNCSELRNPAFSGATGVPNKIKIGFTNRQLHYADDSASAQNQANAVGQDGQVRELKLNYPGVCTPTLAGTLAARELSARSRPMFKCQAICSREMCQVNPGDAVLLNWPEWNISNVVMRVAAPARGSLEDGTVTLDLIQDFYYAYRSVIVPGSASTLAAFPGSGAVLG